MFGNTKGIGFSSGAVSRSEIEIEGTNNGYGQRRNNKNYRELRERVLWAYVLPSDQAAVPFHALDIYRITVTAC